MNDFIYGVLAGVVASFVFVTIVWLFKSWLWPFISRYISNSPNLHKSEWDGVQQNGSSSTTTLQIRQYGDRLRATITWSKAEHPSRVFNYIGKIVDNQLVFTWVEKESGGGNIGAFVFQLSADRQTLDGKTVYVKKDGTSVVSEDKMYIRRRAPV